MSESAAEPQFSADRRWWWTGSQWVPASEAPTPPAPPVIPTAPATSRPAGAGTPAGFPRWLVIVAAILFFPVTVVILIVRTKWSGRTKAILSGVWVVFVIAVGIASAGSSSQTPARQLSVLTSPSSYTPQSETPSSPSASTAATPTPRASPSPTPPVPSPTPTPPAPAQTVVTFLNAPLTVHRGSNATLQVKTAPNTSCSIEVDYKSGPSSAAGLVTKNSDGAGNVSWTWKVGADTSTGSWPITVTCGNGSGQTQINVT